MVGVLCNIQAQPLLKPYKKEFFIWNLTFGNPQYKRLNKQRKTHKSVRKKMKKIPNGKILQMVGSNGCDRIKPRFIIQINEKSV